MKICRLCGHPVYTLYNNCRLYKSYNVAVEHSAKWSITTDILLYRRGKKMFFSKTRPNYSNRGNGIIIINIWSCARINYTTVYVPCSGLTRWESSIRSINYLLFITLLVMKIKWRNIFTRTVPRYIIQRIPGQFQRGPKINFKNAL